MSTPNVGPLYKSANGTTGKSFTGNLLTTKCASSGNDNTGCAFGDVQGTAGHPFNMAAGGVFATLWDDQHIAIWRFDRNQIPEDIQSGNPNPDSWGTPVALWSTDSCDIASSFKDLSRTFSFLSLSKPR
jgi:hypothetical protein